MGKAHDRMLKDKEVRMPEREAEERNSMGAQQKDAEGCDETDILQEWVFHIKIITTKKKKRQLI